MEVLKITGKCAPHIKSVKDESRQLLIDPDELKARWEGYFDKLYDDPNEVDEVYLIIYPETNNIEAEPGIGLVRVEAEVGRLKHHKAPGVDNIMAEEFKAATQGTVMKRQHRLCDPILDHKTLQDEWK
jgi:hypothetical protein